MMEGTCHVQAFVYRNDVVRKDVIIYAFKKRLICSFYGVGQALGINRNKIASYNNIHNIRGRVDREFIKACKNQSIKYGRPEKFILDDVLNNLVDIIERYNLRSTFNNRIEELRTWIQKKLNIQPSPPLWPHGEDYINAIRTIQGNKLQDYVLPDVDKTHVELKHLDPGHPAYKADTPSLGLFCREDRTYIEGNDESNIIGYYAGILRPCWIVPHNPYIMTGSDEQNMDVDAFGCGNEMRYINDYRNVAPQPNCIIGDAIPLKNHNPYAPDWIYCRPIMVTCNVSKGQEFVMDYGNDYWDIIKQSNASQWFVGQMVEVDMSRAFPNGEYCQTSFLNTYYQGPGDTNNTALISVKSGKVLQVPLDALSYPRGPSQHHDFSDKNVEFFCDGAWWSAFLLGNPDEKGMCTIVPKKTNGPTVKTLQIDRYRIRPRAQRKDANTVALKKRKL